MLMCATAAASSQRPLLQGKTNQISLGITQAELSVYVINRIIGSGVPCVSMLEQRTCHLHQINTAIKEITPEAKTQEP